MQNGGLFIVDICIQLAFRFCHSNGGHTVAGNIQRSNQHLNGTIDGQDQRIGNQCLVTGEAHTGQNGKQDNCTCTGGSGRPIEAISARTMMITSWKAVTS